MKATLQKQLAYKYKDKKRYKHVIVIPEEAIEKLGWKGGQELKIEVNRDKMVASAIKVDNESEGQ